MQIEVDHSGLVELQKFQDQPDGDLYIATSCENIPFEIKRVYFINNLQNETAVRGKHAHKELTQIIFCINGSFTLALDDGHKKQSFRLSDPSEGIILGPMLWHEMKDFSKDCVILVFANGPYNRADYIRRYEDFKKAVRQRFPDGQAG